MAGQNTPRPSKRNLVRWNEDLDKKLLLAVQYICNAEGVKIPWDKVATIMGPFISDGAVVQHLAKLRQRMIASGLSVPPPLKRGGGYANNHGAGPSSSNNYGAGPSSSKQSKKLPALKAPDSETDGEDDEDVFDAETSGSEEEIMESQPKRAKHDAKDNSRNSKGKMVDSDEEDVYDEEETSDVEEVVVQTKSKLNKHDSKGKGRDIKGKKPERYVEETSDVDEDLVPTKTKMAKNQPKGKDRNLKDKKTVKQEEDMPVSPKVGEKRKRQGNAASILNKGKGKERAKTPPPSRARRSTLSRAKLSKTVSHGLNDSSDDEDAEYDEEENTYVAAGAKFLELENSETPSAVQSKIVTLKVGKSERAKQFLRELDNGEGIVTDSSDESETDSVDESAAGAMNELSSINGNTMIQGSQNMDNPTGHEDFGGNLVPENCSYQSSTNVASMAAVPRMPHTAQAGAGGPIHPAPYAYLSNNSGNMPPTTYTSQAVAGDFQSQLLSLANAIVNNLGPMPQTPQAGAVEAFHHQPQYLGFSNTFGDMGPIPGTPRSGVAASFQQSPGVSSINGSGNMGPATYVPHGGAGKLFDPATSFFNVNSPRVPDDSARNSSTTAFGNSASSSAQEGGEGPSNNTGVAHNMATRQNMSSGFPKNSAVPQNTSPGQNHGTSAGSAHGVSVNNFGNGEVDQPNDNHYHGYSGNDRSNNQNFFPGVQEPTEQHGTPGAAQQANSTRTLPESDTSNLVDHFSNAGSPHLPSSFVEDIDDGTPMEFMNMFPSNTNDFFGSFLGPPYNQDDPENYFFRGA